MSSLNESIETKQKSDSKSFSQAEINWLLWFGAVSLAIHGSMAMIGTVYGPTQPYIATFIGSNTAEMSFVWTFTGAGWLIGSIVSSAIFKRFITTAKYKVIFSNDILSGIAIFNIFIYFHIS